MSWLSPSILVSVDSAPEIKMLDKFFTRHFPFILEVSSYSIETSRNRSSFILDVYVSPQHFCELMDGRIEREVVEKMREVSDTFVKVVIPEWSKEITPLNIRFFPQIERSTILSSLGEVKLEF
jgi:hypothetical protein